MNASWEDLRRALASLRRSGSVARFRIAGRNGEEYVIRMRQARGRWRIVSVDRDGEPVLLGPADTRPPAATADADAAGANGAPPEEAVADAEIVEPEADQAHLGALVDEASELVRALPKPRPRTGKQSPFLRKLADGTWTVQVASTVDAVEAEVERESLDSIGEPAFLEEAEVRGATWRRVLVGRYPTRADAEETLARLTNQDGAPDVTARR
jgi:cell division protein FtsN